MQANSTKIRRAFFQHFVFGFQFKTNEEEPEFIELERRFLSF